MEFGIVIRQITDWDGMRSAVLTAEDAGFDSVWLIDHLHGFPPSAGILEAWTALAAIGASTRRVGIGAQVLCQAFRSPALLAKMATTLDEISGGRLRFLIGAGWNAEEYRAYGYPFPSPGQRVEQLAETMAVLRGLWDAGDQPFTYVGKHFEVHGALNLPAPRRRIPLGIGGQGPRMLRLAGRLADEWNCPAGGLADYDRLRRIVDAAAAEQGRQVRRSVHLVYAPGDGDAAAVARFHPELGLRGSTAQMVDRVGQLAESGVDALYGVPADARTVHLLGAALPELRSVAAAV